jgi:hypothetical protein
MHAPRLQCVLWPLLTVFQVREVFEELGLQGEILEESCKAVGSTDETLLEFMKVWSTAYPVILLILNFFIRLSSLVAATKTWSAVP